MNTKIKLSRLSKLVERLVVEGKHWPEDYKKTAYNTIKNSELGKTNWYSDDFINADINTFVNEFGPLSHKNSNLGYFATIIRWFVEYSGNDKARYQEFIERKLDGVIRDLLWLSNSPAEEVKVKEQLKTKWTFADFEKYQTEVVDKKRNVNIDIKTQTKAKYKLFPMNSYEELHNAFGGDKTGYDGSSEWCHTNGKYTYDSWIDDGKNKFYILARTDWKNIKPKPEGNAYDDYGVSLIALLVEISSLKLKNATLRWNHIIEPSRKVPGTSVDHAFSTWEQINKVAGFDVEAVVKNDLKARIEALDKLRKNVTASFGEFVKQFSGKKDIWFSDLTKASNKAFGVGYEQVKELLVDVVIPEGVVTLPDHMFDGCVNLKSVKLPSTLKSISAGLFQECTELESIEIPNGVEEIKIYAFNNCEKLKTLVIPDSVKHIGDTVCARCKNLQNVEMSDSVTELGAYAFYKCEKLKSIKLSNNIKEIGQSTFWYCENLKKVNLPESLRYIKFAAFAGCKKLTNVTFPPHLSMISDNAFSNCRMSKIDLPASTYFIGSKAFRLNPKLTEVIIRGKLKNLKSDTFVDCKNLASIKLPNTIENIYGCVFYNNAAMERIVIPPSIKYVASSAFTSMEKLKEIIFIGKTKAEVKDIIRWKPEGVKIKVKAHESNERLSLSELKRLLLN